MDFIYFINVELVKLDYYFDFEFLIFDDEYIYIERRDIKVVWFKLIKQYYFDKRGLGNDGDMVVFCRVCYFFMLLIFGIC